MAFSPMGSAAKTKSIPSSRPSLLQKVSDRYSKLTGIRADIEQTVFVKALDKKTVSKGTIALRFPEGLRWEMETPEKSLTIGDGKKYYFYTPPFNETDRGQVVVQRALGLQTRLASSLLKGQFTKTKDATFKEMAPRILRMTPKKGTAGDLKAAVLGFDSDLVLESVTLDYASGNTTEILLKNLKTNPELAESLFKFEIPKGTEVIEP